MSDLGTAEDINVVYRERNLAVAFAVALAAKLHKGIAVWRDEADPDWVVVYIEMAENPQMGHDGKQLSWHLPLAEFQEFFPHVELPMPLPSEINPWDGHTTEQKNERIKRYINHVWW